ncbi:MAG TPA: ABC transporter substrate-binding protein [Caldilineaceae bacterium]|nr:ABC transporter substrate-binding protein [Caldilineaceae bacterium]
MSKLHKLLTLFALLSLFLTACAAPAAETGSSDTAAPVAESAADTSDGDVSEIIIGTLGEAQSLNPILTNETEGTWRTMMMFDPLIELHPVTFEPMPRLASEWEISEDGLTYTFHLREDSMWHDGTPVTAEDVAFTVMQILAPDYTGPDYSDWSVLAGAEDVHSGAATEADGVEVVDEHTIAFHLVEPSAPFLVNAVGGEPFIPLPKHLLEGEDMTTTDFNTAPVGNGPYKFVSWEVGNTFVMEANPDWWGGEPAIKRVVHRNIPDSQTLVVALEAGEIDGSLYALPTVAESLQAQENLKVMVVPFDFPNGFKYNFSNPAAADIAVRKAIAYAVDNDLYASEFLLGLGEAGLGPVAPGIWAFNETLTPYPYDPELAKQTLEEAGWVDSDSDGIREKDGTVATIVAETNAGNVMREDYCTYKQAALLEIGIDWQCEFKEWSVIVNDAGTGEYQAIQPQWAGASVEPHELYSSFHTNGSNNTGGYSNAEVDALLEEGAVTVDQDRRKEIYDRVQEIIMDELPATYDWYRPFIHVIDNKFDGPWLTSSRLTGGIFRNLYDWEVSE